MFFLFTLYVGSVVWSYVGDWCVYRSFECRCRRVKRSTTAGAARVHHSASLTTTADVIRVPRVRPQTVRAHPQNAHNPSAFLLIFRDTRSKLMIFYNKRVF